MPRRTLFSRTALVGAIGALAASAQFGAPAAHADGPIDRGAYGMPWAADGLANLEIGKATGRRVSYRFRADASGTVTAVRVFFIYAAGGYAAGDGGDVRISLQTDSGGLPSGSELTSALVSDPMAANFRTVRFASGAPVVGGRVYHLVFSNPSPKPTANYVSIDDLYRSTAGTPMQPLLPDSDLAVLLKYGSSSAWDLRLQHTPIFTLFHSDGSRHGPGAPYVNARSSSGIRTINGTSRVAQLMTPGSNVTATGAAFRVRHNNGSGAVTLRLKDANGSDMRTCSGSVSGTGWVRCTFTTPYTLAAGSLHRLAASTPADTSYSAWPVTEEAGLASPWQFKDGYAQYTTDNGTTWITPSAADDFQAYLTKTP
jgi:hypothetical protein